MKIYNVLIKGESNNSLCFSKCFDNEEKAFKYVGQFKSDYKLKDVSSYGWSDGYNDVVMIDNTGCRYIAIIEIQKIH